MTCPDSDPSGRRSSPPARRRQATPIELSALLMEAVCGPAATTDAAVAELAEFLELSAGHLQGELMFVRAFAVDFATSLTLGDSAEREAIRAHYYEHWDGISAQAGGDVAADLDQRLQYYADAVGESAAGTGLAAQVGQAFAALLPSSGEGAGEVAVLGASMFAALFEEVCDLLNSIELVLYS